MMTVLYLTVYFGNIFTVSTLASQVIEYVEDLLEKWQHFINEAGMLSV